MSTLDLHNSQGKVIGKLELPEALRGKVNTQILWQAVRMYLANRRQGTADTKTRSEVSGGGRKPWAQKHTGRARHGSIRSPIWRKGGIVFGPHPRDYRYPLPQELRRKALTESVKARVFSDGLIAVDEIDGSIAKTKGFAQLLRRLKVEPPALVVVDRPSPSWVRASRNLPKVTVVPASDLTCYDVLRYPRILVTASGWQRLTQRLAGRIEGVKS